LAWALQVLGLSFKGSARATSLLRLSLALKQFSKEPNRHPSTHPSLHCENIHHDTRSGLSEFHTSRPVDFTNLFGEIHPARIRNLFRDSFIEALGQPSTPFLKELTSCLPFLTTDDTLFCKIPESLFQQLINSAEFVLSLESEIPATPTSSGLS
jgi:hypothetical protein